MSPERVRALRRNAGRLPRGHPFPPPIAQLARGPVWDLSEVEEWARAWKRQPSTRKREPMVSVPAPPAAEPASTGWGYEAALAELERMRSRSYGSGSGA